MMFSDLASGSGVRSRGLNLSQTRARAREVRSGHGRAKGVTLTGQRGGERKGDEEIRKCGRGKERRGTERRLRKDWRATEKMWEKREEKMRRREEEGRRIRNKEKYKTRKKGRREGKEKRRGRGKGARGVKCDTEWKRDREEKD